MLEEIMKTLLRSTVVFVFLLLAFGLSFYVLLSIQVRRGAGRGGREHWGYVVVLKPSWCRKLINSIATLILSAMLAFK